MVLTVVFNETRSRKQTKFDKIERWFSEESNERTYKNR